VVLARDDAGPAAMTALVPGARRVLWILDPDAGDRIGVVPALGPTKGLATERRLIDLTLLSTAQGLALTPTGADLRVSVQGDLVRVTRPGGLTLSAPSAELERARLPE